MITPVMAGALLAASAIVCGLLIPRFRRLAIRLAIVDVPHGRKEHVVTIPLLGGLAIYFSIVIVGLPAAIALEERGLFVILGLAGLMAVVGWIDDRHPLKPQEKLVGQLVVAVLFVIAGYRLNVAHDPRLDVPLTALVVVGITNAMNLLDNMNGLAAGLAVISATALGGIGYLQGSNDAPLLAVVIVGACIGFLPYNFPRASIFMGDAGALMLGFLLAVLAILNVGQLPIESHWSVWLALLVPIVDTSLVIVSRSWRGLNPLTTPGADHISHRLARRFNGRTTATLICWTIGAVAAAGSYVIAIGR